MSSRGKNQLRIIGGEWRGRIFSFPEAKGLRPTPDRVRETLFNWLQGVISGARCLDLFAGSGALGLEALSRGASEVIWVERNPVVAMALNAQRERLEIQHGQIVQADALSYLQAHPQPFDIIFLDPPFHQGWIARCVALLAQKDWLATRAWIYLETEVELSPLPLPPHWELIRMRRTRQVSYNLAYRFTGID